MKRKIKRKTKVGIQWQTDVIIFKVKQKYLKYIVSIFTSWYNDRIILLGIFLPGLFFRSIIMRQLQMPMLNIKEQLRFLKTI